MVLKLQLIHFRTDQGLTFNAILKAMRLPAQSKELLYYYLRNYYTCSLKMVTRNYYTCSLKIVTTINVNRVIHSCCYTLRCI